MRVMGAYTWESNLLYSCTMSLGSLRPSTRALLAVSCLRAGGARAHMKGRDGEWEGGGWGGGGKKE